MSAAAHAPEWLALFKPAADLLIENPFRNLWPLMALPAVSAVASRNAARTLPRTPEAGLAAALLAAAPGLVALCVFYPAFKHWAHLGDVKTWRGVVHLWITPAIAGLMLAWAMSRSIGRQWAVAELFRASRPAGPRLAAAAQRLGVRARELPTTERECFVAGLLRPTVFVSRGALDGLDDSELLAALHHERAHILGGDTRALFLLGMLRDLAPWGGGEALDAFLATREARADREAANRADRLDLASALLALARPARHPAAVLPMAASDGLHCRLHALLEGEAPPPAGWAARVAGAIGVNSLLAAWPIVQFELCVLFSSL